MEDTLREGQKIRFPEIIIVLILVLMEDTLRVKNYDSKLEGVWLSLNPCFNGRYSQSADFADYLRFPGS